jgi:predicted esterase
MKRIALSLIVSLGLFNFAWAESKTEEKCVIKNGVNPWHDRNLTIGNIEQKYLKNQSVPKQYFNKRQLQVPKGTKKALIGIWEGTSAKYEKKFGLKRIGSKFDLMRNGGPMLKYDIMIFLNPEPTTNFKKAQAGIVLLALDDTVPQYTDTPPVKGRHILAKEQVFEAQEWPFKLGKRLVKMYVREPSKGITPDTGFMLLLHNWGGNYKQTVPWCDVLADKYDVIAISVNYLQSGEGKVTQGIPYDMGYLQAMDCIRALYEVIKQLNSAGVKYCQNRFFAAGGSGGGNVSLMVNKLAPHTFACIVDMCGMPGLTDKIAYGKGRLNAGYSKSAKSPAYLSPGMQEIRNPGHWEHLKIQKRFNPGNKVVIVHGLKDPYCTPAKKIEIFKNMVKAGFMPDAHFLTEWYIGKKGVTTTGHAIGDRLKVIEGFADAYLTPDGQLSARTTGKNDFQLKRKIIYPVSGGKFVIDYSNASPQISFTEK